MQRNCAIADELDDAALMLGNLAVDQRCVFGRAPERG
jgi:hypothetical protein